jgi:anti-sigma-K factor RskA
MNVGPDHERWEDTAGTYVLGALPDDEKAGFEAHLALCPACRAEADDLSVAAEMLPVSVPALKPSPALKARIMAEVEREASLLASASGHEADRAPRRRFSWRLSWPSGAVAALACAALLVGLGVGALAFGGGSSGRTVPFKTAPALQAASAELEINGDKATLVANHLPAPPGGKVYMVWLQRPGEAPQPTSALFTPRADGSATAAVTGDLDGVQNVMVSAEPLGGSTSPTSAPVLTATLT